MLKKSLFAIAAVALLATAMQAGEIKIHNWPTGGFIPQEIPILIPVKMDIGYWVHIKDQDKVSIKMSQIDLHTYEGCDDMVVECNFNLTLSISIHPTGAVGGDYSKSITPADIDAPGGSTTVCATLKKAKLGDKPGGSNNVHVANIKVKVVPR